MTIWVGCAMAESQKAITVGVVQIVDHPALNRTREGIEFLLNEALEGRVKIVVKEAQGNVVNAMMASRKFITEGVDVIITLGTSASVAAAQAVKGTSVPVVFSSVTDPVGAGLVKALEAPGGQVTGVSNATPQKPQLSLFRNLVPNLKTIGMVYNPGEPNSVKLIEDTKLAAKELGLQVETVGVTKTHEVALAARKLIDNGVGAIFINNDNTALAAFDVITQVAGDQNIPVFVSDADYVNPRKTDEDKAKKPYGALAALGPDQYEIGLKTAEMALLILDGKDPSAFAVRFPDQLQQIIDPVVAKKLEVKIPLAKSS